jgi:hypothetical protein
LIAFDITPGQRGDIRPAAALLATLPKPDYVLADTAYDADKLRQSVAEPGATAVIKPNPRLQHRLKEAALTHEDRQRGAAWLNSNDVNGLGESVEIYGAGVFELFRRLEPGLGVVCLADGAVCLLLLIYSTLGTGWQGGIQAYAAELEKRLCPHLRMSNGSWRVDEIYVKVKGRWIYLYRAVDSRGQTIDFLPSAKRDSEAAKRFFRKAFAQPHTVNPRTITVGKNAAYPKSHCGDEKGRRALAPITAATGEIPEQYRRARPSERETVDPPGLGLRWLLDGPTITGRLRGDGNVEERSGSEHQWQRHQGSGNIHRRTVSSRRLRGELGPLEDDSRPSAKTLQQNRQERMTSDDRQSLNAASPASDRAILQTAEGSATQAADGHTVGTPAGPKFLRDERRRYQARRQPLISFGELLARPRRRKHDHRSELLGWLRRRPHARRRSPWSAKFNGRGLSYLVLRIPASGSRNHARRAKQALLRKPNWLSEAGTERPRRPSRRARQQEPGMNQNASGLSIMAGLTAGVGSRTADCGMPYTGLTANGLARHTGSAFSGDVTAPGERRLHLEWPVSRLA